MTSDSDVVEMRPAGEILVLRDYGVILWKNPVKSHKVFIHKRQQGETLTQGWKWKRSNPLLE